MTLSSIVTLHWSGASERFWNISPTCPIFLLPQLESLEISCARVGQDEPEDQESEDAADRFQHQTRLKSLTFIECVVSAEALHTILSFPSALRRLTLCEKFYHHYEVGDRFAANDDEPLNLAIAQQSRTLEHLHIHCQASYMRRREGLSLSLSDFPVLSHLQLGPFPTARPDAAHCSNYTLSRPVPPALSSLRIDHYGISMLKSSIANRVFSELAIDDLLRNAESRGQPFTFDISLHGSPPLLRRPGFHGQDHRQIVGKYAEELGKDFRRRLKPPIRWDSEPSSSEQVLGEPTPSRLRILTNKLRHKIPPFLHNEGPQRFVVRYDSSLSEKVLGDPYPIDELPSDRDMSSEDEDMDAAFGNAGL